jgi:hypothetical protein
MVPRLAASAGMPRRPIVSHSRFHIQAGRAKMAA